jgi:hypothetical protein
MDNRQQSQRPWQELFSYKAEPCKRSEFMAVECVIGVFRCSKLRMDRIVHTSFLTLEIVGSPFAMASMMTIRVAIVMEVFIMTKS